MLINPEQVISNGWISHPDLKTLDQWKNAGYVSPNAIDFPITSAYTLHGANEPVIISNEKKNFAPRMAQDPGLSHYHDGFFLESKSCIDVMSDFHVDIPEGVAAWLIVRSTFSRNGVFITSGLWDSGFKGNIGCMMYNMGPSDIVIKPGTRIGQVVFSAASNSGLYTGSYSHAQTQRPPHHWLLGDDNE